VWVASVYPLAPPYTHTVIFSSVKFSPSTTHISAPTRASGLEEVWLEKKNCFQVFVEGVNCHKSDERENEKSDKSNYYFKRQ
jgi:hypothetical protein